MQSKVLNILRWILVIPISIGLVSLLDWFSTTVLETQLDRTLINGIKRTLVTLTSTISSVLVAGLIAPNHKFRASCGIAILWIIIVLLTIGISLFTNKGYEILDGGISITSVFIGLISGVLISWLVFSQWEEH
jgi:drug/metabolite transporter (DMT)-like permease